MNVPLVNNDILTHFRSVSPQVNHSKLARERSPKSRPAPTRNEASLKSQDIANAQIPQTKRSTQSDQDAFKVYVRVRPTNSRENTTKGGCNIAKKEDSMLFVLDPETGESSRREKAYAFDGIFDDRARTEDIYSAVLTPAIQNIIQGFNSTIFAYGMTGAGKTFTMFGDLYNSIGGIRICPGLVNLIVRDIFQTFAEESEKGFDLTMKLSYIEIYNEQIRDLLNPAPENLMIIEDPAKGILIPNLFELPIGTEEELLKLIITGNAKRVMASTHANQFSSRSHAIIQFLIERRSRVRDIRETYTQSKLCFVDLAGSERAATTENRGLRLMEGANINKSLLALGNCINVLSDTSKKGAFVPYRDSKLTRLLKDSLGGNTRTVMIACISPSNLAYEETVNTLNYASRARRIKKKITSNVKEVELHVSQYKDIIETLRREIGSLKTQLQEKSDSGSNTNGGENGAIQAAIDDMEGSLDKMGKMLFLNLEENWEIGQSLKELKDLRAQNETTLLTKKEEQSKAKGDAIKLETLTKEIESLVEVMKCNEKIELEMEANLERNLKEKKQIEEKILSASYQYGTGNKEVNRCREDLEKSFHELDDEKKDNWNGMMVIQKEFIGLHKEKIEKDNKIQQLEKEIDEMKRQLAEKDKLLSQNQNPAQTQQQLTIQTAKPSLQTQIQTAAQNVASNLNQPAAKSPTTQKFGKLVKSSYSFRGLGGVSSKSQPNQPSKEQEKDTKAIKNDKVGSLQDIPARLSAKDGLKTVEENLVASNKEPVKRPDSPARHASRLAKDFVDQNVNLNSVKKVAKASKGSGLNENNAKTTANSIRQVAKNKYKQAEQHVSVEELKDYAEKIKNLDFDTVQRKQKKGTTQFAIQGQISPLRSNNLYSNPARASMENKVTGVHHSKKNSLHNFSNRLQKAGEEKIPLGAKPPGQKTSRNPSHERDFSEISSIMVQNHDGSIDQSVDDYILGDQNVFKRNSLAEARAKKECAKSHDVQSIGSRNFHLNIMYLMKDDQDKNLAKDGGLLNPLKSNDQEGPRTSPYSSESKNNSLPSEKDNYLSNPDFIPVKTTKLEFNQAALANKNALTSTSKEISPLLQAPQDSAHCGSLFYMNYKNPPPNKPISKFDSSIRSQDFDNEGFVSTFNQAPVQTRHTRSTSLHQDEIFNAKKSMANLEDSNSHQKTQDTDIFKKNTNDIRTLEAARDMIRTFRVKLSSFSYVVDNNLLDDNYTREVIVLLKDYHENKYLLSNKDAVMLAKLEAAVAHVRRDSVKSSDMEIPPESKDSKTTTVSTKGPKYISTSIKDLENMQETSKYQGFKKLQEADLANDSASSGQGSNQDDRSVNFKINIGGAKESNFLYSKSNARYTGDKVPMGYYSGEKTSAGYYSAEKSPINYGSISSVNIYNQFSSQDTKSSQPVRESFAAPKTLTDDNSYGFKKISGMPEVSDTTSSRGKANLDVQHLIEKQKRNLEEFDKMKKENTIKNVIKGVIDIYNSGKIPHADVKQEWSDRDTKKQSN